MLCIDPRDCCAAISLYIRCKEIPKGTACKLFFNVNTLLFIFFQNRILYEKIPKIHLQDWLEIPKQLRGSWISLLQRILASAWRNRGCTKLVFVAGTPTDTGNTDCNVTDGNFSYKCTIWFLWSFSLFRFISMHCISFFLDWSCLSLSKQ